MYIIGIDCGQTGGFAILDEDGNIVETAPMPAIDKTIDLNGISALLSRYKDDSICYLEKVASRPGQGVASTFKFGRNYGAVEGILACLRIPYQLVTPTVWCKEMHAGVDPIKNSKGKNDTKKMSEVAINMLYPKHNFLATERSKKKHEGMVDATLIAEYGRRKRRR